MLEEVYNWIWTDKCYLLPLLYTANRASQSASSLFYSLSLPFTSFRIALADSAAALAIDNNQIPLSGELGTGHLD